MAKVKVYSVDRQEKYRIAGELFEIIASLKTKKEVVDFLIGLFTASETLMIARRIQIAKMLILEKNYDEIRKELKVSFQTINKVEHWLKNDEDKMKLIAAKIKAIERREKEYDKKYSGNLLDKYAHHRFLKDLFG